MSSNEDEAKAFDSQIAERIAGGHIPDLRLVEDCDYFHDNPWRRKAYVNLDFGQIFMRVNSALQDFGPTDRPCRVLEIGCGPGYISLELSRNGHHVTGVDLSGQALEVAQRMADDDPWKKDRGSLEYIQADVMTLDALEPGSIDAVLFIGSLHHMPDTQQVCERAKILLRPGGLIMAHEPTRDRYTEDLCVLVHFIYTLLAVGGGYFKDMPIPADDAERSDSVRRLYNALKFETEDGEKVQSPNDNEAGYGEMHPTLTSLFEPLVDIDTYAFFHEMIGGLRFDEETNANLARFIRDTDALLVKSKLIPATEFFFVGRKTD
jgi:2-polyprenyl-6-hydroxyphenyl methylase/3-demethylubiquinone-9 3-methyltransferase